MSEVVKSIIRGIARLLPFRKQHETFVVQSDSEALRSDWQAVGNDMWQAIRAYGDSDEI